MSDRTGGAAVGSAADGLRALLQDYDRADRLAIDAVYAQFSPTLDDYYAEDLLIAFAPRADAAGDVAAEIVLTRTVPGQEPKAVRGAGAPFPLRRAGVLAARALAAAGERGAALRDGLASGRLRLRPRQVGRSQAVALVWEPAGGDVLAFLDGLT
jgi:hypothetical protein